MASQFGNDLVATIFGCTPSKTELKVLDSRNIPVLKFNGSTTLNLLAKSETITFDIKGECDPKIRGIEAALGGSNEYRSLDTISSLTNVACASGSFSFTLKGLFDLGITPIEGKTYQVLLRGLSSGGASLPSTINLLYSTPNGNGPRRMTITSGSTESSASGSRMASSANFKAQIRAGFSLDRFGSQPVQSAGDVG